MQFIKAHYLTDISQAQSLLVHIADENYSDRWCVYQPKATGPIRWRFLNELPTVFKSKSLRKWRRQIYSSAKEGYCQTKIVY